MGFNLLRRLFPGVKAKFTKPVLWVHCASVGEFNTFLPLLKELRKEFSIALTYFSPRAEDFLRSRSQYWELLYPLPLDLPFSLRRFEKQLSPKALIVVERELWPCLVSCTQTKKILVNAYAKGRGLERFLARRFELILTRGTEDEQRFKSYGAKRVKACGNMKFLVEEEAKEVRLPLQEGTKLILAGSTHEGEEEILLRAFSILKKSLPVQLVIAPRHVSRAVRVAELARRHGFKTELKTGLKGLEWEVLVVDTLGELKSLYRLCDVAVVGGTFVPVGGHNLLEPLVWQKPVVFGRYTEKVRDMEEFILSTGSGVKVESGEKLAQVLLDLIKSPPKAVDIRKKSKEIKDCYLRGILSELE